MPWTRAQVAALVDHTLLKPEATPAEVTAVAERRGDVTILDAPAVLAEVPGLHASDPRFAQFWPHRHGTDAIFLALLRRD